MNKFTLISAILQLVCAIILIGISVYYFVSEETLKGVLYLAVGIFFVFSPARKLYKHIKSKNKHDEPEDKNNKRGFL